MEMNIKLPLTTEWFEMTKTVKTEDYREITPYWTKRLVSKITFFQVRYESMTSVPIEECSVGNINLLNAGAEVLNRDLKFKPFTTNTMTLGYPKKGDPERTLMFEHAGIKIGFGNPEWGAPTDRMVFIIKHGKQIEQ